MIYKSEIITESDGFFYWNDYEFETLKEAQGFIDYNLENDYDDSEEQRVFEDQYQNVNY